MNFPSVQESALAALEKIQGELSWLDKVVRNPRTGNRVKVRNLPDDIKERYRPKKETKKTEPTQKSSATKGIESKYKVKVGKNSPVNYDDGKTPKTHPTLFAKSSDGQYHRLARPIPKGESKDLSYGKPEFNPAWKKDPVNEYYAKVPKILKKTHKNYSRYAKEGKTPYEYVYTVEHFTKNNRVKFLATQNIMKKWPKIKNMNAEHRKKNPVGSKEFAAACIFGIQLETAARIGTKGNESRGIFGAHNLQRRHFTFKPNGVLELDYVGKDGVKQHKRIEGNPALVADIKKLYDKTKKANDPVLTWEKAGKVRMVNPDDINGRTDEKGNIIRKGYLQTFSQELGIEITSHKVRHVWACRIFTATASQVDRKKIKGEFDKNGRPTSAYLKAVNEEFMKCANAVAAQLGNEAKASINNYIDPTLMINFWRGFGIQDEHLPKSLRARFAKASDLLFAHLAVSQKVPQKWMFEGAHADNFFDFNIFLGNIDFTDIPPTPKELDAEDLQQWI